MSESKSEEAKVDPDSKETPLSGDEVLEKVSKYFYEDDTLAKTFEEFIDSKADIVDLDSPEYKLEYTDAYEQYKELFEDKIGNYIEKKLGSYKPCNLQLQATVSPSIQSPSADFL